MTMVSNTFNLLVQDYVDLRTRFRIEETAFRQLIRPNIFTIRREIKKFQVFLTDFTLLYEKMLQEKLLKDSEGERTKYLEAIMATINKIQSIYLLNLTQKEGRQLNNWNFGIAFFSILFGLGCTVYSIWYAKVDSQPTQDELFKLLRKHEKQINRVIKEDSLILDRIIRSTVVAKPKSSKP